MEDRGNCAATEASAVERVRRMGGRPQGPPIFFSRWEETGTAYLVYFTERRINESYTQIAVSGKAEEIAWKDRGRAEFVDEGELRWAP